MGKTVIWGVLNDSGAGRDGSLRYEKPGRTAVCQIDPNWKYRRSNGYGEADIRHDLYVEAGRTPWAYRPAGPGVIPGDSRLPYPLVCAHRGLHGRLPENSLAAFGAAVALGAPEIEFDLYATADGELVVCHDDRVERISGRYRPDSGHDLGGAPAAGYRQPGIGGVPRDADSPV